MQPGLGLLVGEVAVQTSSHLEPAAKGGPEQPIVLRCPGSLQPHISLEGAGEVLLSVPGGILAAADFRIFSLLSEEQ